MNWKRMLIGRADGQTDTVFSNRAAIRDSVAGYWGSRWVKDLGPQLPLGHIGVDDQVLTGVVSTVPGVERHPTV